MSPPQLQPHSPHRPDWLCILCRKPWPCPGSQLELTASFSTRWPPQLRALMTIYFVQAAQDMPTATAGSLLTRFLGWTSGAPISVTPWSANGKT